MSLARHFRFMARNHTWATKALFDAGVEQLGEEVGRQRGGRLRRLV